MTHDDLCESPDLCLCTHRANGSLAKHDARVRAAALQEVAIDLIREAMTGGPTSYDVADIAHLLVNCYPEPLRFPFPFQPTPTPTPETKD